MKPIEMFRIWMKWIWTVQFAAILVHANRCLSSTNNRMYDNCIKHIKIHCSFLRFVVSFPHFHINSETSLYDITYSNIKCAFIVCEEREGKNETLRIVRVNRMVYIVVACGAGTNVNYHSIFDRY